MSAMLRKIAAAIFVACALVLVAPYYASAEPSSEELQQKLDAANAHLNEINIALLDKGEELNETQYQLEVTREDIETTKENIEVKQAELEEARTTLSTRVSDEYKTGPIGFLSILFKSNSFEEFISHIYYADKVSTAEADAINTVEQIKTELKEEQDKLETKEAEQVDLLAQIEQQQAELEQQVADQAAYVNSLDEQVREALAREEEERRKAEEEAARKAAEEAARKLAEEAEREAQQQAEDNNNQNGSANSGSSNTSSGSSSASSGSSTSAPKVTKSSGGLSADQRNTIIAAAYSCLGTPYVYGGEAPGRALDCSGTTQYAYRQAGISLPHSSMAQMGIVGGLRPVSSLTPGDLVFWTSPRHVAIYLGNNQIIEAIPGPGVSVRSIWGYCLGGGCPV